jgi:hypothetical protein
MLRKEKKRRMCVSVLFNDDEPVLCPYALSLIHHPQIEPVIKRKEKRREKK